MVWVLRRWFDVFVSSGLGVIIFWSGFMFKTLTIIEDARSEERVEIRLTTLEANYVDIMRQLGRIEKQVEKIR